MLKQLTLAVALAAISLLLLAHGANSGQGLAVAVGMTSLTVAGFLAALSRYSERHPVVLIGRPLFGRLWRPRR